jgi:hypothetical protein
MTWILIKWLHVTWNMLNWPWIESVDLPFVPCTINSRKAIRGIVYLVTNGC